MILNDPPASQDSTETYLVNTQDKDFNSLERMPSRADTNSSKLNIFILMCNIAQHNSH